MGAQECRHIYCIRLVTSLIVVITMLGLVHNPLGKS